MCLAILYKKHSVNIISRVSIILELHLLKLLWKWSRSVMSDSATPWTVAYQAPQFMEFSRQENYFTNHYKESWEPKNWCFWTVVLEKTLENPLDSKEIKPINPKGNQSWIFIGRTEAKAETPILWPSDAKNWLIWKDPDAGKDWRWEEKGTTEDEVVGWYHRLNQH